MLTKDKIGVLNMELIKNVFFNTDKLIENTTIKISYTGTFFENNSEKVFIHYGFGENWEDVTDVKMEKSELGFQTEIELPENDSFRFCLKNDKDEWDNNDGQNYVFPIEHIELALTVQENSFNLASPRKLRKSYLISKKIRITIYKIITYLPRLVSGNYRRKATNEEN